VMGFGQIGASLDGMWYRSPIASRGLFRSLSR
jgi:hypothetical protein